ncbi:SDR family NAD(P)-dependent oxidoreductase [Nakamurella sp. YIM 132087]|uniref:SDR family NAD(P)-dependent oxidoreductase n=1 Tax=Nakamurella alba TaxID=2665158 RepID=A0A7K1FKG4_9ACTN|nr:SDR family NAD(P)-dependent oxidoreductase [Nakamurella alba]MTD14632.1 SDR family NAD(P)-dependent oxidoreductase [Nakamurella alba]
MAPSAVPRDAVVVVTGASSGLGRATALALASPGRRLVLAARSEASLHDVAAECVGRGAQAEVVVCDVGRTDDVEHLFDVAVAGFGRVDAVVHAPAAVAYGRFDEIPAEIFDAVITTNLLGTAYVARVALRHFRGRGEGKLVLFGSLLGKIAVPYMSPYVTSKWGVHALVRMLQIEARETPGIGISLISPGSVNTPAYSQAANVTGREGRPPPPVDPPEKIVRAVIAALGRPRREVSVGLANPLAVIGFRVMPAVYDRIVAPLMRIGGLSRRPVGRPEGTVLHPHPEGNAVHGSWNFLGRRTEH